MEVFSRLAELWDKQYTRQNAYLAPAHLRYRVHGSTDVRSYLEVGARCAEAITAAVQRSGKSFDAVENILDFGCGCARTVMWFVDRRGAANLYGTDIDAEAISWCRRTIDFASFATNRPVPPLEYPSEIFDVIYAMSVFTHLKEQDQFRWLSELQRVAKPGGILLLSVHGKHDIKTLAGKYVRTVEQTGFIFVNGNAYHTQEYLLGNWSEYFNVVDCIPRGVINHDLVVLRKAA